VKVGDLVRLKRKRLAVKEGSLAIIIAIEEGYSHPSFKLRFFWNTRRKTTSESAKNLELVSESR
jgi:hypothetical protein